MSAYTVTSNVTTVPIGVGDAVGMEKSEWYIAIVNHNTEKAVGDKLKKLGYDCYVPIQEEYRLWKNGRRTKVNRVVIPSIVFIHCTETVRKEIVALPFIHRFMTNKAGLTMQNGNKPLAIIPNDQIERLRFMLGHSDIPITFTSKPYKKGDFVRVIRGKLTGLEGEVRYIDAKQSEIIINIEFLGNARLAIETINVELIPSKKK